MVGLLRLSLASAKERYPRGEPVELIATFENAGPAPFSLTFWWNRRLRVLRADGSIVAPGEGPELPCGIAEEEAVLRPGESLAVPVGLECTQPAGLKARVGWRYRLDPGGYRIVLVHEQPPPHGFGGNPRADAWRGVATSNEVPITVL